MSGIKYLYPRYLIKPGKDPLVRCGQYIHLIDLCAKMLATIGNPECQFAYLKRHGTRDNVFILNTIIDKYKAKGLHLAYVDFTAAFDI